MEEVACHTRQSIPLIHRHDAEISPLFSAEIPEPSIWGLRQQPQCPRNTHNTKNRVKAHFNI